MPYQLALVAWLEEDDESVIAKEGQLWNKMTCREIGESGWCLKL